MRSGQEPCTKHLDWSTWTWPKPLASVISSESISIAHLRPDLTTEERRELAQLRKENRKLQMERDILNKAAAFFAKESN